MKAFLGIVLCFATTVAALAPAGAQTWTGAGGDTRWTTPGNWTPAEPVNNGTATPVFGQASQYTSWIDAPWSIRGLTFLDTAGAYTFGGSLLTVGADGIANAPGGVAQTFTNGVALSAHQTWTPALNALLVFEGMVDLSAFTLTVAQTGGNFDDQVGFMGGLKGSGAMQLAWGDYYFFGDASAYTGPINRTLGVFNVDRDNALGSGLLTVTGYNRNDFNYHGSGSVILGNDVNITTYAEMYWRGGHWVLTGDVTLNSAGIRQRGASTYSGDMSGRGGIYVRQQPTASHVVLAGHHRYLGQTLFNHYGDRRATLEVNGVLTAGDVVDGLFVRAQPVVIADNDRLTGTGHIYRDVAVLDAGDTYWDGQSGEWQTATMQAVLDGALNFGGLLTVNSSAGTGSVTLFDGGILAGRGRVGGSVTVQAGGVLSPGDFDESTLSIGGDLFFHNGSRALIELAGASAGQYDRVAVDGTLTFGGELALVLTSPDPDQPYVPSLGDAFHIFAFDSALAGGAFDTFNFEYAPLPDGLRWDTATLYDTGAVLVASLADVVLGDFNGDGVLSGLDIPGFKQALADPGGWAANNPDRPHPDALGDFNADGVFSGLDIPGFKQALAGGAAAIPEPATELALAAGVWGLMRRRRNRSQR